MIHIVKGVTIVNDTEVEFFLEFSYFLYGPMNISILSSGSSAFSKSSSYIGEVLGSRTTEAWLG